MGELEDVRALVTSKIEATEGEIADLDEELHDLELAGAQKEYSALSQEVFRLKEALLRLITLSDRLAPQLNEQGAFTTLSQLVGYLTTESAREREGRLNALCQLAAQKEAERFGRFHRFADGSFDKPLLTAQSAGNDEYEDEDDEE